VKELLSQQEFNFIKPHDKDFITSFDIEMNRLGYTCNGNIGNGYCWGRYMVIYTKAGIKSKKSYARVYIRDEDIVLRLYLSNIDKHGEEVGQAPEYIQEAFTGEYPSCDHCHDKTECVHQKRYTINGNSYEICDGKAFWFFRPNLVHLPEYLKLFTMFYPQKKKA